jgi:tRNA-specific 2-thiouridylase
MEVIGVTMRLHDDERDPGGGRGCCGSRAARDAGRVAAKLGIPHYSWDFRREFEAGVIDNFCGEYSRGRTPNPCIRCNQEIKFTALLERAAELGAEAVATGHHARVTCDSTGQWGLRRGADGHKDQSYFLYGVTQAQLARVLMPVGDYTKDRVRELARQYDLPVAEKQESQEICFVPDDDHVGFLRRRKPAAFRPGPVLEPGGRELGRHQGIPGFTIGQRRGLGLALGERRYVIGIDAAAAAVVLGSKSEVGRRLVEAAAVHWISSRPPAATLRAWAKVRYQSTGGPAVVEVLAGDRVRVTFDEPQWAPAPGQAVVFWEGEQVLGGGTIERSLPE